MPSRILREGLVDSDAIGQVTIGAEMLFVRLLLLADDFGRYDGRVSVICRRAFVNRRSVDDAQTAEWLHELADSGLIELYESAGRGFLQILNFRQRTRQKVSKFPEPPYISQSLSGANDGQMTGKRQTDDGRARTYSESESESESESKNIPLTPCGGDGARSPDGGSRFAAGESAPPSAPDGRRVKSPPVGIKAWLQRCSEAGLKPVPPDDPVFGYADKAGIHREFIALHWREFKTRHAESSKRYADWSRTLLNSVRGNWYGLWLIAPDGSCTLSTKGLQAKRVQEAIRVEEGAA